MVLGFGQTLHSAPVQLMRLLAQHRKVRIDHAPAPSIGGISELPAVDL